MIPTELQDELKRIEKEQAKLARKKNMLAERLREEAEQANKLEDIFQNSGYSTPRALVKALMVKYGVSITGSAAMGKPRKRTRITAELRDEIRNLVNNGLSKNAASKQYEVSYAVVTKIMEGHYDNL